MLFGGFVCHMETLLLSLQFFTLCASLELAQSLQVQDFKGWLNSLKRQCCSGSFLVSGPFHEFLGMYPCAFSVRESVKSGAAGLDQRTDIHRVSVDLCWLLEA